MRGLLALVGVLSVLLIAGAALVVGTIIHRSSAPRSHSLAAQDASPLAAILDQPAGSHVGGMIAVQGNVALLLQGGGPDRVVLIDGANAREIGSIRLSR